MPRGMDEPSSPACAMSVDTHAGSAAAAGASPEYRAPLLPREPADELRRGRDDGVVAPPTGLVSRAQGATRRVAARASARAESRAIAVPTASCARAGRRDTRVQRSCAFVRMPVPSAAASASRRRAAPSTDRSRLPASSSARRVSLRGCVPSPHARTLPPASSAPFLRVLLSVHVPAFSFRALLTSEDRFAPRDTRQSVTGGAPRGEMNADTQLRCHGG